MDTESTLAEQEHRRPIMIRQGGGADAVYGIGLFGAWVYYFRRANTPRERALAFFKGFVWPAFLVYGLFEYLEKK